MMKNNLFYKDEKSVIQMSYLYKYLHIIVIRNYQEKI